VTAPFDDLVFDYVSGTLGPVELAAFERDLEGSAVLRGEVEFAREVLSGLALDLAPVAPSPSLRDRVLASSRVSAWDRFADAVARLWDVSVERTRAEFARAMAPESWSPGPVPGVSLFHLDGGPAVATADVGIVRFAPGTQFFHHSHTERERYVVLEGCLFDSNGTVEGPGDEVENSGTTFHSFSTDPTQDTVIALVLHGELITPER
jgi:anti-sigma factor ChrR (cupin superfamily)